MNDVGCIVLDEWCWMSGVTLGVLDEWCWMNGVG